MCGRPVAPAVSRPPGCGEGCGQDCAAGWVACQESAGGTGREAQRSVWPRGCLAGGMVAGSGAQRTGDLRLPEAVEEPDAAGLGRRPQGPGPSGPPGSVPRRDVGAGCGRLVGREMDASFWEDIC